MTTRDAQKPLRMKSADAKRYTLTIANVDTIINVCNIIDDDKALELLSTIHPVDRARVYRAMGA